MLIMSAALALTVTWTSTLGFVVGTTPHEAGQRLRYDHGRGPAPPTVGRERFLGWWMGAGNIGQVGHPFVVAALASTVGLAAGMWLTVVLGLGGHAARLCPYRH